MTKNKQSYLIASVRNAEHPWCYLQTNYTLRNVRGYSILVIYQSFASFFFALAPPNYFSI